MAMRWLATCAALLLGAASGSAQPAAPALMPAAPPPAPSDVPAVTTTVGSPDGPDGVPGAAPQAELPGPGDYKAHDRFWVSAEYLLWWLQGSPTPPLIGTLPAALAPMAATAPSTLAPGSITPLFGGGRIHFPAFSGARITAGDWLDQGQYCGLEASVFALQRRTVSFTAQSTPDTVVGLLFMDVTTGTEDIITPVNPSAATESATAAASLRLWGAEANWRTRLNRDIDLPCDGLAGFRYLDLAEELNTAATVRFTGDGAVSWADHFATTNHFYGGQVGVSSALHLQRWSLTTWVKIGLGDVSETVRISGSTQQTLVAGLPPTLPGGVLTAPSNIGVFSKSRFAVLPEANIGLGYQLTRNLQAYVAYNVLYLSSALRPGNTIDSINPANVFGLIVTSPSPIVRPLPSLNDTDFWAQGLNLGLEFRY